MNGNGARIARVEKALDGYEDPHHFKTRLLRWWREHVVGNPAATAYVRHFRTRARDAQRRQANGERPDPAEVAANVARLQAWFDTLTDEELAAAGAVECERQRALHERGECDCGENV